MNDTITVNLEPQHLLGLVITAHDARACHYWLSKQPRFLSARWWSEQEEDWEQCRKTFKWELVEADGLWPSTTTSHSLTYPKLVKGARAMLKAEIEGTYRNRFYRVVEVLTGGDSGDSVFADQFIQFCLFGKVIYG